MGCQDSAQALALEHRVSHHILVLHTLAVVGESDDVGGHTVEVSHFFTLLADGDGAVGVDMDQSIFFNGLQLHAQMLHRIGNGIQIGHGAYIAVSAPGTGSGTGRNGLFIQKTRLTKMYMNINETG